MRDGNPDPQEILRKLRDVAALDDGDSVMLDWMNGPNGWGSPLSQLCADAANLIERCLP